MFIAKKDGNFVYLQQNKQNQLFMNKTYMKQRDDDNEKKLRK